MRSLTGLGKKSLHGANRASMGSKNSHPLSSKKEDIAKVFIQFPIISFMAKNSYHEEANQHS